MKDKNSVVMFDLGRVLMHIDFDAFPNALGLKTEEERKPYKLPIGKLWKVHETGKMTTDEFLDTLFVIFDGRFAKEKILEAWDRIIVEDNASIVPFVRRVQKRYRTAILSNTSPSHWKKVMAISSLARSIPAAFTSFDIGAMKPDPAAYNHVIKALNVAPQEILFIDDLKENIDGAVACGLKGIVYTDPASLERDAGKHIQLGDETVL
jgi:putative hydrolase of the HAD superfamily